ncbi:MAG: hypothetical protein JXR96_06270 [Deltaproteobacteria bacterium]|nr:hypothetical protein [Deltaproteobacteria bacterium]
MKVSKKLYLGLMGGFGAAAFAVLVWRWLAYGLQSYQNIDEVMEAAGLNILARLLYMPAAIFLLVLIYKMWQSIQGPQARTTPGRAVGFCFIPFYNFYWIFQATYGFARDYNALAETREPEVLRLSGFPYLALPIVILAEFIIAYTIPVLSLLANLAHIVVLLVFAASACDAINRLAGEPGPAAETTAIEMDSLTSAFYLIGGIAAACLALSAVVGILFSEERLVVLAMICLKSIAYFGFAFGFLGLSRQYRGKLSLPAGIAIFASAGIELFWLMILSGVLDIGRAAGIVGNGVAFATAGLVCAALWELKDRAHGKALLVPCAAVWLVDALFAIVFLCLVFTEVGRGVYRVLGAIDSLIAAGAYAILAVIFFWLFSARPAH